MSIAAALATTGDVIGLANDIRTLVGKGKGDRKDLAHVLKALQTLYFAPNGVLGVLEQIANGGAPEAEQTRESLLEFNDGEWQVQRAAQALDFNVLGRVDLSLRHRNLLQSIAYGKLDLRRDLQDVINAPADRLLIEQSTAQELVNRIRELNRLIEDIDEALRGR